MNGDVKIEATGVVGRTRSWPRKSGGTGYGFSLLLIGSAMPVDLPDDVSVKYGEKVRVIGSPRFVRTKEGDAFLKIHAEKVQPAT